MHSLFVVEVLLFFLRSDRREGKELRRLRPQGPAGFRKLLAQIATEYERVQAECKQLRSECNVTSVVSELSDCTPEESNYMGLSILLR